MTGDPMSLFAPSHLLSLAPLQHTRASFAYPWLSSLHAHSVLAAGPSRLRACARACLARSATSTALSIGSGGTRALCRRPPSARRCYLVVPIFFRLSHPRFCVARVVAPSCAKGCTICPCDPLTRARVHALLVPFVLALAGNFPASKFPALRLLLALRLGDRLAIIGSANINEQSQLGDRDSELAVVIRSTPTPRAHLLMQPRNPHSAATEYMPRHRASSDLHCGGDYGASDRGRRAFEAGNVALRLGVERGEAI
ncbi:hypothetical protein B0H14DRAFT_2687896 [Mycena olivaceomarginata]|nr:hypothetical protein B0H14DRAFT_2687896 [Mycena olivaceomarginata]